MDDCVFLLVLCFLSEHASIEYRDCIGLLNMLVCLRGWWQLDEEDFKEEQNLVARLVHMLVNDDNEQMFQVSNQNMRRSLKNQMNCLQVWRIKASEVLDPVVA